jgi:hypothetical protein
MRPATRQARVLLGVVPFALAGLGILTDFRPDSAAFGLKLGVLLAATFNILAWTRSLRFETLHADESAEFWARHEAHMRPRAFLGCCVTLVTTAAGAVFGLAVGWTSFAVCCAVISAYALILVTIMAGKIP